ncbi:putative ubiquitin-like-specific protease 1B isoform X2 [Cajanus cajan]|uniref:putative ubiquitin-like-specific protease 1B isoform X2 n=1 Tax=Cajanus cajan TaxID=3821 RepID=UPI00098DC288|nr:putative ubiquitin-like-specific protease 1B isoform X2 [Cajanus cajan]XP_020208594.1 putative ubiquitin-like-specific protease 1B isoform X2 [Cajanus cajan]
MPPRKRKNSSTTAKAGSMEKDTTSEAVEPSSSAIRAPESRPSVPLEPSGRQQVKKAVDKKSLSMLNKLYYFCTRRPNVHDELSVLVSMFGVHLGRKDSHTMRPKGWVSFMVILAAGKIMMEEEKATNGAVTRHIFSPQFMSKVLFRSNLSNEEDSYKPWCIEDVSQFISPIKLGYDINQCKFIFAPTLFEEHWSCYAFEPKEKTLYVLDPMQNNLSISKKNLDDATKRRFEELLVLMSPGLTEENASVTLVYVDVPRQKNNHDCGIYVMKYMEIWDGSIKWQDKSMPDYQDKEIQKFRQSFMCGWVQHPKNEVRETILKAAQVWEKLG